MKVCALVGLLLCACCCVPVSAQDLTALEQRTEALRAQLRDVTDKETTLRARMQQLDEDLKPENVQNRAALTGVLDGATAQEQVRKQIEGEKGRVQQQLDLLATSRAHLETAISEAEAEAVRRRAAALAPSQVPATPTPQLAQAAQPSAMKMPPRRQPVLRRRRARRGRRASGAKARKVIGDERYTGQNQGRG